MKACKLKGKEKVSAVPGCQSDVFNIKKSQNITVLYAQYSIACFLKKDNCKDKVLSFLNLVLKSIYFNLKKCFIYWMSLFWIFFVSFFSPGSNILFLRKLSIMYYL